MAYRLAKSLDALRRQINALFPNRSKVSDGWIGDTAHAARKSDHNPNSKGVVQAFDITHDVKNGVDCNKLAKILTTAPVDARIKYIIWNGKITRENDKTQWKIYTGKNRHDKHLHISVSNDAKLYDADKAWNLDGLKTIKKTSLAAEHTEVPTPTTTEQPEGNLAAPADEQDSTTISASQPPMESQATEASKTEKTETAQGSVSETVVQKNEQDVNQIAEIKEPEKQGVAAKLKAGIGTLFGGTIIYTIAEKFGAMSFSTQAIILFAVVAFIALIGFMFWAWLDAWKQNQRVRIEADAKTAIDKKDIKWV